MNSFYGYFYNLGTWPYILLTLIAIFVHRDKPNPKFKFMTNPLN